VQLEFELRRPHVEKSSLVVQQKAVPKGLRMEVEVPPSELSRVELPQTRRVEAVETQRQEYTMQVRGGHVTPLSRSPTLQVRAR